MVLTVDVGNTNIVLGLFKDEKITKVYRLNTDKSKTADEYAALIKGMMIYDSIDISDIEGAIISCVVPPLQPALKSAIEKCFVCKVYTVSPGTKTGLNIAIDEPASSGGDLVCDCVGALALYKAPLIVVDLGTATKILPVDRNKAFLGGAIMPGIGISMEALSQNAALLPHIDFSQVSNVIGKNSVDCMRSGIVYGTACQLDGLIELMKNEMAENDVTVIITGGFSGIILPYCKTKLEYEPNLALYGAYEIYKKNVPKK